MSSGYRGPVNTGPPPPQQNYVNNFGGGNALHPPPSQQSYYGQPTPPPQMAPQQTQMYHQPLSNAYQQMGQIPRPMNTPQPLDTRSYGQPMPIQNRS